MVLLTYFFTLSTHSGFVQKKRGGGFVFLIKDADKALNGHGRHYSYKVY